MASPSGVSPLQSPCGACKYLRRKCMSTCIFAPYFPPDQGQRFANVHKIFGSSNFTKLLQDVPVERREDAVNSICLEAEARIENPIYGCVAEIYSLKKTVTSLENELEQTRNEINRLNSEINRLNIAPLHSLPNLQEPSRNELDDSWNFNNQLPPISFLFDQQNEFPDRNLPIENSNQRNREQLASIHNEIEFQLASMHNEIELQLEEQLQQAYIHDSENLSRSIQQRVELHNLLQRDNSGLLSLGGIQSAIVSGITPPVRIPSSTSGNSEPQILQEIIDHHSPSIQRSSPHHDIQKGYFTAHLSIIPDEIFVHSNKMNSNLNFDMIMQC